MAAVQHGLVTSEREASNVVALAAASTAAVAAALP
jgi:hypothetical protein